MANEIEAKFEITHVRATLLRRQLKGHYVSSQVETNEFYDTKKGKLDKKNEVLRICECVDGDDGPSAYVTFKGAPVRSRFKSRPEFESRVDSAEAFREIFKALGYTRCFLFEKRRERYDFGGCFVEIDELPRLGSFCEIEGSCEALIEAARNNLGLSHCKPIKDGYGGLLLKHAKKNKLPAKEVRFEE